jgi:hypothetical protein
MNKLDERKQEFLKRNKNNKIESILRTMRGVGITIEDLQGHKVEPTSQEKLAKRREIEKAKEKARLSLIKAREAKKAKQQEV